MLPFNRYQPAKGTQTVSTARASASMSRKIAFVAIASQSPREMWLKPAQVREFTSFLRGCGMTAEFAAQFAQARDQFGIAFRQPIAVEFDIVFKTGAKMSAEFERLAIDLELMPADPSPCCVGHDVLDFGDQKFEHAPSAGNRWRLCCRTPGAAAAFLDDAQNNAKREKAEWLQRLCVIYAEI